MERIVVQVDEGFNKFELPCSESQGSLTIGRAYSNDLILEDPYVGPSQLLVKRSSLTDGFLEVSNCDETNPLLVNNRVINDKHIEIKSGDRLTVGRTRLAFFDEVHPVANTREFSFVNWLHNHRFNPVLSLATLATLFGLSVWFNYLSVYEELQWRRIFAFSAIAPIAAFGWALAWAMSARMMKSNYYFFSHLFFSSVAVTLILLLSPLYAYLDYYFSNRIIGELCEWLMTTMLIGLLIGFNLTLMTHISGAFRKGMAVSVFIFGLVYSGYYLLKSDYANFPVHSMTVMPQSLPTPEAKTLDAYIKGYDDIFEQLERSETLIEEATHPVP